MARAISTAKLRRATRQPDLDAVLQIGDIGVTNTPFFTVQDLSYDLLLDDQSRAGIEFQFAGLTDKMLTRLRDRQQVFYSRATGVIALSHWFGRHLVEVTGVPEAQVHVVHPGVNIPVTSWESVDLAGKHRLERNRTRLLFIGRDFARKGGKETLDALAILRKEVNPNIVLTVVGPPVWPMDGMPPPGVDFRGARAAADLPALYDEHDLFVMPSRFEAFGIVFAEALSRGLPCIGRDAFAMSELISPGRNGQLVASSDPVELASTIAGALNDDALLRSTAAQAREAFAYYSWDRAARDVENAIFSSIGLA